MSKHICNRNTSKYSETIGEIGLRHCLRIQALGTEYRQPKTKVPARTW